MEVIKAIRSILIANTDITDICGTRIYAYVAPQEAVLPYIVVDVVGVAPSDCKNGPSSVDECRVQIDSAAKTSGDTSELDEVVRTTLDRITKGTISGVSIQGIRYDNSIMMFEEERQIRMVASDYEVRVVRSGTLPDIPGIYGLQEYISDEAAIAAGLIQGQYYIIAEGSDVGPAGLIKKVI
jgi:hypothetical protein